MYLHQRGYPAVAVTGTVELTDIQISILRRMAKEVIVAYDNDIEKEDRTNPGQIAQAKVLKKLRGFFPVYGVTLPKGRDVDQCSDEELEQLFGRIASGRRDL